MMYYDKISETLFNLNNMNWAKKVYDTTIAIKMRGDNNAYRLQFASKKERVEFFEKLQKIWKNLLTISKEPFIIKM